MLRSPPRDQAVRERAAALLRVDSGHIAGVSARFQMRMSSIPPRIMRSGKFGTAPICKAYGSAERFTAAGVAAHKTPFV
jgi:hypothetical protein